VPKGTRRATRRRAGEEVERRIVAYPLRRSTNRPGQQFGPLCSIVCVAYQPKDGP
jgi:hypothetical protein